jgi:hypothetical protein
MNDNDSAIECSDCESEPVLYMTPYRDEIQYVVACDCNAREIDVSDCVVDSALVEAITGKWANFDGDNPNIS